MSAVKWGLGRPAKLGCLRTARGRAGRDPPPALPLASAGPLCMRSPLTGSGGLEGDFCPGWPIAATHPYIPGQQESGFQGQPRSEGTGPPRPSLPPAPHPVFSVPPHPRDGDLPFQRGSQWAGIRRPPLTARPAGDTRGLALRPGVAALPPAGPACLRERSGRGPCWTDTGGEPGRGANFGNETV